MRSDSDIERDVKDELQWDPDLDATDIAVSVKSGVVTLAGYVKSYSDNWRNVPCVESKVSSALAI
jgi:osmotically-inducible protein OsmY